MKELPWEIRKSIGKYEEIVTDDLTLYPILVEEYEDFCKASPAIEFMQQQFKDVRLMSLPLLQAFYKKDYELAANGQLPTELFFQALLFLALSLRIGIGLTAEERVRKIVPVPSKNDNSTLRFLSFQDEDGEWRFITPVVFQRLRPILAAQNGIELEDDAANPDLVFSAREMRRKHAPKLEENIETLVASVATFTGEEEARIYEWPVLKLFRRASSIKRMVDYAVNTNAELQGTKWKNGNPFPSPWFDREQDDIGLLSLDQYSGNHPVQQADSAEGLFPTDELQTKQN